MATLPQALGLSVCQENRMQWRLMSRAPWNNISGGSPRPEWWLSDSGQVAQSAPDYSLKDTDRSFLDAISDGVLRVVAPLM